MNKPQQIPHENYLQYNQLFFPNRPFTKYILYNPKLGVELTELKIQFYYDHGNEITDYLNGNILRIDTELRIFIDFDNKIMSLYKNHSEVLRFNFDYYIMENNYSN